MSKTPRTDAAELEANIGVTHFDHKDLSAAYHFARQLERELNALNQCIKRLIEAGDRMDLYASPHDSDKWNEAKECK